MLHGHMPPYYLYHVLAGSANWRCQGWSVFRVTTCLSVGRITGGEAMGAA